MIESREKITANLDLSFQSPPGETTATLSSRFVKPTKH